MPEESSGKALSSQEAPAPSPEISGVKTGAPEEVSKPGLATEPEEKKPAEVKNSEAVERARRLSRTIINDIYLYNSAKVMESIRNGNFYAVFAPELKEGQKLYENRITQEIRNSGNYYNDTIEEFISKKKKELS